MNKKILGSSLALLSVMAFAFEWWFVRELETFGLTGFYLLTALFFTATIIFSLGIFSKKIREKFPKTQKKFLFAFGFFDVLAFSFFFLALLYTPVVRVLLWSGLAVFYVLFLSSIFLEEKISKKNFLGTLVGFFGIAIYLVLGNTEGEFFSSFTIGDLYAFGCGASMGVVYTIGSKMKKHSVYWKTFFTWLPGAILFPIIFYFFPPDISLVALEAEKMKFFLLFVTILLTSIFLAMICFQFALKYISATKISTIRLTEPLWQGLTAFFIAHESLNFFQLWGAIILFIGIYLVQRD